MNTICIVYKVLLRGERRQLAGGEELEQDYYFEVVFFDTILNVFECSFWFSKKSPGGGGNK